MIAYVQVRDSAWEAFLLVDEQTLRSQNPDVATLRENGQLKTGYWNGTVNFIVVGCTGEESEINSFYSYFLPEDTLGYWKWGFDGRVDFVTEYAGQQDDILFLQKNHPDGSPASFEKPNWGHIWLGQGNERDVQRFARYHARDHGEEFG